MFSVHVGGMVATHYCHISSAQGQSDLCAGTQGERYGGERGGERRQWGCLSWLRLSQIFLQNDVLKKTGSLCMRCEDV